MLKKEMILFYVEEKDGRLGASGSLCIGFDGIDAYQSAELELPTCFESMVDFLKNNILTVQKYDTCMYFLDILMNSKIQNVEVKTISDFKFADPICLGGEHYGYSLGQLTVNVKVWRDDE